jgi:deoxycytidylate deaminase
MQVADTVALRSACVRAKHGCVIVDDSNRIIATGYNGPPSKWDWHSGSCQNGCSRAKNTPSDPFEYDDCIAIHAEANALLFCDRRERELGTLYVNGAMCLSCAKLVANSGVSRVVMRINDNEQFREPSRAILFLELAGMKVVTH